MTVVFRVMKIWCASVHLFSHGLYLIIHKEKNSQNVSCSSLLTAKTGTSETDRIGCDPFERFINVDRICF